jgi:hypothetical protein
MGFGFSWALEQLKAGKKVKRVGWNGKDMYLYVAEQELQYPPLPEGEFWKAEAFAKSKFIVMKTADNKLIPWLASQTDIMAGDWSLA